MPIRRTPLTRTAAIAVVAATLVATTADADGLLRRYRVRRLSDATAMASPPFTPADDAPDCAIFPGVPEVLGPSFDPSRFDQIEMAGNGRFVAFASLVTASSPGARAIVVLKEGGTTEFVAEAAGDDDQPSLAFDRLGWRMAFRGSDGTAGETPSNVYLHTVSRFGGTDGGDTRTRNLTDLDTSMGLFARDPSLAARTITRTIQSGVKTTERDARVAFVSNGDLDKGALPRSEDVDGRNAANREQVFVWRERDRRFRQITDSTDDGAAMARTSISGNGRYVAFESTADLTPDAANPRDPSEVGNPGGVRQIYLWVEGRRRDRIVQLTWGAEDSFAPRITANGRYVFFCSSADLLPGGNPDGNFEIFRWRRGASPAGRLAQLTETPSGDSVLPRPTRSPSRFVFYSTASPPIGGLPFGDGLAQCGPTALLWQRGRVRLVAGLTDIENAQLVGEGEDPVLTGPPAAVRTSKVHFATNDPLLDPPDATGEASLIRFHMARATRFPRGR